MKLCRFRPGTIYLLTSVGTCFSPPRRGGATSKLSTPLLTCLGLNFPI
ncbi:hypothetical protein C8R31_103180 [Nitrosospira sp. Nsp2]|nr:hypothetical protein C8R31_103180 [Nitrosospira sp. Nsp2]